MIQMFWSTPATQRPAITIRAAVFAHRCGGANSHIIMPLRRATPRDHRDDPGSLAGFLLVVSTAALLTMQPRNLQSANPWRDRRRNGETAVGTAGTDSRDQALTLESTLPKPKHSVLMPLFDSTDSYLTSPLVAKVTQVTAFSSPFLTL